MAQAVLETLPRKMSAEDRATLEREGFKLIGSADDLFDKWQFPEGWRKEVTDHSFWTNLLDEKGTIRGKIFFKAAFYDRRASLRLKTTK